MISGEKIRKARQSIKASQMRFAELIGERTGKKIHFHAVSNWERGVNAPSNKHLMAICAVTGKSLNYFFEKPVDGCRMHSERATA